jgi:BCCT family betaine/carnitine transporter
MSDPNKVQTHVQKGRIDKTVFWPATIITLVCGIIFYVIPEQSNNALNIVHAFTTSQLGWFFLVFTVLCLGVCMFYAFSPMGKIVLGKPGEKPIMSTQAWVGMVLTSGTGGSLLYLASIEWVWIISDPPFGVEPESVEAFRWAMAYGMFHWGPSAWALYIACAIPIAYFFFVKRRSNMKMSDYARPLLGKQSDGVAGHILNFLYIFGLLGGVLTSMALGTAPIAEGFAFIFGMDGSNLAIEIMVILLWSFVPLFCFWFGMKKGIVRASRINIWAMKALAAIVIIAGPTWFILNQSSEGLGVMIQNFFIMSLATDPVGEGGFPQAWTIFYMSWWAVYAMPFGLFIAKISKGRTIRQTVIGALSAGSIGCMIFYMILPAWGMNLQLTGQADLVTTLANYGRGRVVIEMFLNFPLGLGVVAVGFFTLLVLFSFITGHITVGYSLAASAEKKIGQDQDPQKWNVTFWLVLAGFVSLGLYLLNPAALTPLQTVSILAGFPICFAILILVLAFFKQVKRDFPDGIPIPQKSNEYVYGEPDEGVED